MKSFFSIIVLILCTVVNAAATRYQARLLDKTDNKAVEYANIGIIGTTSGTNSDSAGYFSLDVEDAWGDKTVIISLIGYEELKISVNNFVAGAKNADHKIYLKKNAQLKELVVKPVKLTFDELGTNMTCSSVEGEKGSVPFPYLFTKKKTKQVTDTLTEIGTLMKVKRKKTFIDSVRINVGRCTYANILYRLNVYEELDGGFKNILTEPIYIKMTKEEVGSAIRINLTEKNLVVNHNFIVSIEKVKDLGPGELSICGKIFGPAMYMRMATQQEDFVKLPIVSMGIAAYVTFSETIK